MVGATIPHRDSFRIRGGAKSIVETCCEGSGMPLVVQFVPLWNWQVWQILHLNHLVLTLQSNTVRATAEGLKQLKRAEEIAALRISV